MHILGTYTSIFKSIQTYTIITEKVNEMAKGPFMEFLGATVLSLATDHCVFKEIHTPNSKTEKLAMLIHTIQCDSGDAEFSAGQVSSINNALAKRNFAAESEANWRLDDPDVLFRHDSVAHEGIVAGAFSRSLKGHPIVYYDPPILYAKDSIYCLISAINTAAKTSTWKIGYTLEKVSDADYIAALVE